MSLINGSALIVTGISEVGGSIALTDTANPLTITGISDTAPNGNISVTNSGALTTTGAVTTAPTETSASFPRALRPSMPR